MNEPIRILHVFGAMNRGGAEMRTLDLMRRLDRRRYHLEFCSLSGHRGSLDDEIRELGGEVHLLRLDRRFPLRFLKLLRERRIDVLHSHVLFTSGWLLALAAVGGVRRRIAHFRTTSDEHVATTYRVAYRRLARAALDRAATDILAVAEGVMSAVWSPRWRDDPRCRVVFNGIDAAQFDIPVGSAEVCRELGIAADAPLVLQIGRHDPVKNQIRAVGAFAECRHPTAHLVLVGRGGTPEEAATRARVEARHLAGRVHFVGERFDIPRLLAAASLMTLTSLHEGMPGVVLEALAAGVPVVATDLPGVREIASHLPGVSTHGLDESDAAWAATIDARLDHPPTAASRAAARAVFRASPFSIEASLAAHMEIWDRGRRG